MPTVVITGATRGIGRELAQLYLADGAAVVVGNRSPSPHLVGLGAEEHALDVSDAASVAAFAKALDGRPVDILINNAGIFGPDRQSTSDMDFEGFAETLAINTMGPLRVTQALWPSLRLADAGKVAVITSRMGALSNVAMSHKVAYRASKAAVNKIVQCLAIDMKADGISVASIHPGWARTDMGGPDGEIEPIESATGIKALIGKLTVGNTGQLWNYDGTNMTW
jgi:NAD(P)-dependent dehydrogenase (short-subunit alcohol dehydrogenase family)